MSHSRGTTTGGRGGGPNVKQITKTRAQIKRKEEIKAKTLKLKKKFKSLKRKKAKRDNGKQFKQ